MFLISNANVLTFFSGYVEATQGNFYYIKNIKK